MKTPEAKQNVIDRLYQKYAPKIGGAVADHMLQSDKTSVRGDQS